MVAFGDLSVTSRSLASFRALGPPRRTLRHWLLIKELWFDMCWAELDHLPSNSLSSFCLIMTTR